MKIKVRLLFHFRKYSPTGEPLFALELPEGASIAQALAHLGAPAREVKVMLINGRQAALESRLADGDELAVFPPVEGG